MQIRFKLRFLDLVKFQTLHQFLSPKVQSFFLLAAIFLSHFTYTETGSRARWLSDMLVIYSAMWLAQLLFVTVYLFSRGHDNVLTDHLLELRPEGVYEETALTQTLVRWPGVHKVLSHPGFVAIYISSLQAHVAPDRAFESRQQRAAFLAQARQSARQARG